MPSSGFSTGTPTNVTLDEGVFFVNSTTAFGVTKGPISYQTGEVWQNIGFAGKRCDVALMDRIIEMAPKFSFDLIELSSTTGPKLFTGSTGTTTITPHAASSLLTAGMYQTNVKVYFKQGSGNYFVIIFPMAIIKTTQIVGVDKDAATISVVVEARQDLSSSTDTDVAPMSYAFVSSIT